MRPPSAAMNGSPRAAQPIRRNRKTSCWTKSVAVPPNTNVWRASVVMMATAIEVTSVSDRANDGRRSVRDTERRSRIRMISTHYAGRIAGKTDVCLIKRKRRRPPPWQNVVAHFHPPAPHLERGADSGRIPPTPTGDALHQHQAGGAGVRPARDIENEPMRAAPDTSIRPLL